MLPRLRPAAVGSPPPSFPPLASPPLAARGCTRPALRRNVLTGLLGMLLAASPGRAASPPAADATSTDIAEGLRGGDANRRRMAVSVVRGLGRERQAALLPHLLRLLGDRKASLEARRATVEALGAVQLVSSDEVAQLLAFGRDARQPMPLREATSDLLIAVAKHFPEEVSRPPALEGLLATVESREPSPAVRESAATALSVVSRQIPAGPQQQRLLAVYRDKKQPARVRGGVLVVLTGLEGATSFAVPSMRQVFADPTEDAKLRYASRQAAEQLERLGGAGAPPPTAPQPFPRHP